jgi:hypothetical protein
MTVIRKNEQVQFAPLLRFISIGFISSTLMLPNIGCSAASGKTDVDINWKLDEHGNPDFKPEDFEEAISVSKSRFGELSDIASVETSADARKFRQIIRWLPEFAADTPIKRAEWEQLNTRTARLEVEAQKPGFFGRERVQEFQAEIEGIAALVPPDKLYKKFDNDRKQSTHGATSAESATQTDSLAVSPAGSIEMKGNDR